MYSIRKKVEILLDLEKSHSLIDVDIPTLEQEKTEKEDMKLFYTVVVIVLILLLIILLSGLWVRYLQTSLIGD